MQILGLIVIGVIARLVLQGRQRIGAWFTVLLGIAGSLIASALGTGGIFELNFLGTIVVLQRHPSRGTARGPRSAHTRGRWFEPSRAHRKALLMVGFRWPATSPRGRVADLVSLVVSVAGRISRCAWQWIASQPATSRVLHDAP
jgi:uncharacterized membrane protein YeaQ/YmgE (transglycosylase-associated protein family)